MPFSSHFHCFRPTGDVTTNWTVVGGKGSGHFDKIDNGTGTSQCPGSPDDTAYLTQATPGVVDQFSYAAGPIVDDDIVLVVSPFCRWRSSTGGPNFFARVYLKIGGSIAFNDKPVGATFVNSDHGDGSDWDFDWSASEIGAMEMSIESVYTGMGSPPVLHHSEHDIFFAYAKSRIVSIGGAVRVGGSPSHVLFG